MSATEAAVPAMVAAARRAHRDFAVARAAVLEGWRGLAGARRWTPGMIRVVEREMGNR